MGLVLAKKEDAAKKRRSAVPGSAPGRPPGRALRKATSAQSAAEALRRAEARHQVLLQLIPDMMLRVRGDGTFLEMLPSKYAKAVVPPEQFLGRRLHDVFSKRVADIGAAALKAALGTGEVQSFEQDVRVEGEVRHFEVRLAAIDGEECLAIVREVTERKRAEEALRDSEERYRVLYEDNPSMFFTVDAEGTVLSVNRFGAEQLGYVPDELVGRQVLDVFHPEDREDVRQQLARCVEAPSQVADWEFRKVRKDGRVIWVKEVARAVRGPRGDPIVLIVCEDISERKKAEERLLEAREKLESSVDAQMARGNVYGLSFRELTVLNLVAAGRSDKEIATLLGITLRTANKHITNILNKMGAASRTEAGVRAVREGLLRVGGRDT